MPILRAPVSLVVSLVRSHVPLQVEIVALRHQLALYHRSIRRASIRPSDRMLWARLARHWPHWREALVFVQPATVLAWQRRRFRNHWARLSRRPPGRPAASPELRALIRDISIANPRWGSPRILGELRTLGIAVAKCTIEKSRVRPCRPPSPFRTKRLAAIGPADLTRYIARRQAEGASHGTINRDLAVLGRMLRLAYENGKLLRLPLIHKLKEARPREGSFERAQFEAVKRHLRPDLQAAASIAYAFGWRMQSEVLTLKGEQVDVRACTLRLDPGTTKNDEGRLVYLTPELVAPPRPR